MSGKVSWFVRGGEIWEGDGRDGRKLEPFEIVQRYNKLAQPTRDPDIIHDPGNVLTRIDHLHAYLSVDDDGSEGVIAWPMGNTIMPLIAADDRRLKEITPLAKRLSELTGKHVRLVRFTKRKSSSQIVPLPPGPALMMNSTGPSLRRVPPPAGPHAKFISLLLINRVSGLP